MQTPRKIITIDVHTGSYKHFISRHVTLAIAGKSSYTCVANVHMLIEAYRDPDFAAVVNNADCVTPDGMPLTLAIRLLYGSRQDRVAGMTLLPDLLEKARLWSIPVYFYGGTEAMLSGTREYLHAQYPGLNTAGMYSPPFRQLTADEEQDIAEQINQSGAKLVFVALGCPKQEKWMAAMKGRVNACMIGIGGALPVMIGQQKRAPLWMQKASLEWLYRLIQEPKRLFKRYAVTNTTFIWFMLKSWARQGFKPNRDSAREIRPI